MNPVQVVLWDYLGEKRVIVIKGNDPNFPPSLNIPGCEIFSIREMEDCELSLRD